MSLREEEVLVLREREERLRVRGREEESIVVSFAAFEWPVVELRAEKQMKRIQALVETASAANVSAPRFRQSAAEAGLRETFRWRLSVKLVRKIEHLNILLEVLEAQRTEHPSAVASLRRRVLASRASAERSQEKLFSSLVH
ncbi:hypothetical protein DIPPA_30347 [Diplonema papillatum]|nr:hypothetical protein DIPPA_34625 [Diplonema papillatum]KAJ9468589.1 hypothetical protein DIPPA_30347 [Diplonema papillatum]